MQAANGPQLRSVASADVDAYDKLSITVPAAGSVDVELGPGGDAVTCLVAIPSADATGVTYKVGTDDIKLDAPLVLLGGAVALSGSPTSLTFDNAGAADASIDILIGRTATT
ncbi:MAG TPA: hypothetical protein VJ850_08230 [Candidatus Limnocylindrales bacterium]|nr:hypothetical protein [Candidatus Limnocylindrales bacterium]